MPSMTARSAACSLTAIATLSWLSSRWPTRLCSAYSTRNGISLLSFCAPAAYTARRGFIAPIQHDPQHDRLRPKRTIGLVGHAHLGAAYRQSSLSGNWLPLAGGAARRGSGLSPVHRGRAAPGKG